MNIYFVEFRANVSWLNVEYQDLITAPSEEVARDAARFAVSKVTMFRGRKMLSDRDYAIDVTKVWPNE